MCSKYRPPDIKPFFIVVELWKKAKTKQTKQNETPVRETYLSPVNWIETYFSLSLGINLEQKNPLS